MRYRLTDGLRYFSGCFTLFSSENTTFDACARWPRFLSVSRWRIFREVRNVSTIFPLDHSKHTESLRAEGLPRSISENFIFWLARYELANLAILIPYRGIKKQRIIDHSVAYLCGILLQYNCGTNVQ